MNGVGSVVVDAQEKDVGVSVGVVTGVKGTKNMVGVGTRKDHRIDEIVASDTA